MIRLFILGTLIVLTALLASYRAAPGPAVQQPVPAFNDGFAASKQDDCQQGFRPACTWLAAQRDFIPQSQSQSLRRGAK